MALLTKRLQTTVSVQEEAALRQLARRLNKSLGALVHDAIQQTYFKENTGNTVFSLFDDSKKAKIEAFRSLYGIMEDCDEFEQAIEELNILWQQWPEPEFV